MSIATADLILTIPIIYGLVRGLFRGFFKEIASIVGLVLCVIAIRLWSGNVAGFLQNHLDISPTIGTAIAGTLLFITTGVLIRLVLMLLNTAITGMGLGIINRLAGMLFGGLKFLLIISLILNLTALIRIPSTHEKKGTIESSQFYEPIKNAMPKLMPFFPKEQFMELIKGAQQTFNNKADNEDKTVDSDETEKMQWMKKEKIEEQNRKFSTKGEK